MGGVWHLRTKSRVAFVFFLLPSLVQLPKVGTEMR
jgi:hypothetical protein